jgi:hypothetical protein
MSGTDDLPRRKNGQFAPRGDGPKAASGAPAGKDGGKRTPARKPARAAARKPAIKWTKEKEAIFFRELAMICNVSSALRKARLTGCSSLAYERRKTDSRFRAAWEEAIDQSYAMLELEMLERARFGDDRPPPATEAEKRLRAIPTSLALQLVKLYETRVKSRSAAPAKATAWLTQERGDALRKRIEQKLSDFNRRMGGRG